MNQMDWPEAVAFIVLVLAFAMPKIIRAWKDRG